MGGVAPQGVCWIAHSQPFIHLLLLVSLETLMGRCCLYPHALGAVASPAHPSFRGLAHNVPPSSDLATFLSHQCAESTTSPGALMPRVSETRHSRHASCPESLSWEWRVQDRTGTQSQRQLPKVPWNRSPKQQYVPTAKSRVAALTHPWSQSSPIRPLIRCPVC